MKGLLDLIRQRPGMAAGGALGALAGGPAGLLAGAAAAPVVGGLLQNAKNKMTASEQELEERALRISNERQRQEGVKRQREAMAALPGLLGAQPIPDGLMGPPAPNQMRATDRRIGLLDAAANLSPQAAGSTLLSQAFPTPVKPSRLQEQLAVLQAAGVDVTQPDVARKLAGLDGGGLEELTQRVNLALGLQQLESGAAEATEREVEETQEAAVEAATLNNLAAESLSLAEELEKLEQNPGQVGTNGLIQRGLRVGQGVLGAGQDFIGIPNTLSSVTTVSDKFDKSLAAVRNSFAALAIPEGATNQQRALMLEAFPTREMQPGAIRAGVARTLQQAIETARAKGASKESIKELEKALARFTTDSVTVEFD